MKANLRLLFAISIFFLSFSGFGQDVFWQETAANTSDVSGKLKKLSILKAKTFRLNDADFKANLENKISSKGSHVLYFPDENGVLIPFNVQESSVMAPELAKKYPDIKSYRGVGSSDTSKNIRFSVSPKGVQSMMVDKKSSEATFMQKTDGDDYILYTRKSDDVVDANFICETKELSLSSKNISTARLVDDQVLRKYRVAISATGEYTAYHGGTKADALAAINATLTRINMVFETDLGVTLELIATTDLVIYTSATTDPYNGNLNTQTQSTLTSVIGAANYDIGHLLNEDSNGGDAGFIGSVCKDAQKGSAYSSGTTPEGDMFDLDFVAHEMGHQLGANHTWSFESEGTQVQAEPGSGTTIMGYAGISGVNNVASNGQDYFHYYSIKQISENLATTSCATEIPIVNVPPVLVALPDYTIPKGTPFVLTGNASDSDASDVLTYAWEQVDDGVVTSATFGPTNPSGALFRSQKPSTDSSRYFPKLSSVISGNLTQTNPVVNSAWETLPTIERDLNFALTVRDNASGGGQVVSDLMKVNVVENAGPFQVLSQNASLSYEAGSSQEVLWDVAQTTNSSVNAQYVDIFLSTDGGVTFSTTLADDVANDGAYTVLLPNVVTAQARIMVKASDNVFFAVNNTNFSITSSTIVLSFPALDYFICQPLDLMIPFVYEANTGFTETATFSVSGLPTGLAASFSPTTATTDGTLVDLTFTNSGAVAAGEYQIDVIATTASVTKQVTLTISIEDTSFTPVVLTLPTDGQVGAGINQVFEWLEEPSSSSYAIEIATDNAFASVVESASVLTTTYTSLGLAPNTTYYWRIKPKNNCGEGVFGSAFSFTTTNIDCKVISAKSLPITISSSGSPTIFSTISFIEDLPLSDVNVILDITHTYLADLTVKLTSPEGTTVILMANSCGENRNVNATFDQSAGSFVCGTNPAINGLVKPLGSLNSFNGESSKGDWILEISDGAGGDGGSLNGFSLELCVEGELRPDADNDGVFDDGDDMCLGTPEGQEVDTQGCPLYYFDASNFEVSLRSESCRANNDGAISISASTSLAYSVSISGNGINEVANFTTTYRLDSLQSGSYQVCISGTDGSITYEQYCFDAVITQPDELDVSAVVSSDGSTVDLGLNGADEYVVSLNGVELIVTDSTYKLSLENGINTLKVITNLPCQGSFEMEYILLDKPFIYPNPAREEVRIFTGVETNNNVIQIFALNGRLVKTVTIDRGTTELIILVTDIPSGVYVLKLQSDRLKETFKLIKQ
ncbi:Proprotein convertase P [Cellulophaga algicola DSM 14237]|uniref:Proprotein convertase P n=1 Tax=Cellulophaga algicola (strain DSM 14237 / IC166 / ACAM 630) TaxID=688270 RepID=E6XEX8_CELAD|nr:zinc-dependent metalloprotease family protein [Cellulophaga algicola]ADV49200.1 Proprotein convertase P [Cellulophaga algicola DSM 14237]